MFPSNNQGFAIYLMAIWETRKLRDLHTCTIDHVLYENLVKERMEISKPTTKKKVSIYGQDHQIQQTSEYYEMKSREINQFVL